MSGYGATRRIVVYDTLLTEASEAEVRSVVAHELSHARSDDVLTGALVSALGAAAAVCAVFLLGAWTGLLRRAGVESIAEPRAIGLLVAVATLAGLVFGPAQAFVSRKVEARADAHALDMANKNYFSHDSQDGRKFSDRITAAGYTWVAAGENIAAGQATVEAVMSSWRNSPGHCANLMSANFADVGVACRPAASSANSYSKYWVMDLGKVR